MVAINSNAAEPLPLELAAPIDPVGRLDVETSSSATFSEFNTGTATLVAPNKILTAAHVIDPNQDGVVDVADVAKYSFLLGDNLGENSETSDKTLGVSEVSLHPSWVAEGTNRVATPEEADIGGIENSQYDLAVLTLSSDVTDIAPVAIAPNVAELSDTATLLGRTGTLIGYGNTGNPSAISRNNGSRRAAENIIDSVDNGLIRFDYDSTFEFEQTPDSGINSPTFDGADPAIIPVPTSSPIPIPLEGEIGPGDSGGPLLVATDSAGPVIVGVASELIDPDAFSSAVPGYGSVDIYTALNDPATLEFLAGQNLVNLNANPGVGVAASSSVSSSDFPGLDSSYSAQSDVLASQFEELNFGFSKGV